MDGWTEEATCAHCRVASQAIPWTLASFVDPCMFSSSLGPEIEVDEVQGPQSISFSHTIVSMEPGLRDVYQTPPVTVDKAIKVGFTFPLYYPPRLQ